MNSKIINKYLLTNNTFSATTANTPDASRACSFPNHDSTGGGAKGADQASCRPPWSPSRARSRGPTGACPAGPARLRAGAPGIACSRYYWYVASLTIHSDVPVPHSPSHCHSTPPDSLCFSFTSSSYSSSSHCCHYHRSRGPADPCSRCTCSPLLFSKIFYKVFIIYLYQIIK